MNADGLTLDSVWESEVGDFFLNVGYRETEKRIKLGDIEGSQFDIFNFTRQEDHSQLNVEFRYSNQFTDEFSLTTGFFYLSQDYTMGQDFRGASIYLFSTLISLENGFNPDSISVFNEKCSGAAAGV